MDANQKLSQFMDAVNRGVDADIERAERLTDEKVQSLLREAESRCRAEAERDISEAKSRITAKYQKSMSQVGYHGKTALLSQRQQLLLQLFADLKERLSVFTGSDRYAPWMQSLLETHQPEEHGTVLLRESDMHLQEMLQKAAGTAVTFRADPAIRMGGLSILSADGRRCENHTLDEAYAAQYRNFYRDHKLDGGEE